MLDQETSRAPVVTLPGEIDLTNAERACDQLHAAFASGTRVVIADLTATTFCDCSSMRGFLGVQRRAAARGAELRLAIPPGSVVHRLAQLMDMPRHLRVYPGPREAAAAGPLPAQARRDPAASPGGHPL